MSITKILPYPQIFPSRPPAHLRERVEEALLDGGDELDDLSDEQIDPRGRVAYEEAGAVVLKVQVKAILQS